MDQLRKQLPDEDACREFLERLIWPTGRHCPHCGGCETWAIHCKAARPGLYECRYCHGQFTVTTKTPLHATKLPLWTWIQALYLILSSSKGVSSVVLGRWIGVSQKSAWKIAHAIREMMDLRHGIGPALAGIVELDEKYVGGKPRFQEGVKHKRGKGTAKAPVFVAVERQGEVRAAVIERECVEQIGPHLAAFVDPSAHLMSDENSSYKKLGTGFASHRWVSHGAKEYARGSVHNNTAESFKAILERAKQGVFHQISKKHLQRYIDEIAFRWNHRERVVKTDMKTSIRYTAFEPMAPVKLMGCLLRWAVGREMRRSRAGGLHWPGRLLFDMDQEFEEADLLVPAD